MDPKLQSSFIPKKPLSSEASFRTTSNVNLFVLISTIIFILTLAVAAAFFFLNRHSVAVQAQQVEDLKKYQKDFSDSQVATWARLDARIKAGNYVIQHHLATSQLFALLQNITVKSVQLTKFEFAVKPDATGNLAPVMTVSGVGRSFNAVSYQSDVFREQPAIKHPLFSGVRLDDSGRVLFSVDAGIDPAAVMYKTLFEGGNQ